MTLDGRLAKKWLLILFMMLIAFFAAHRINSPIMGEFGGIISAGLTSPDIFFSSAACPAILGTKGALGKASLQKACAAGSRCERAFSQDA